MENHFFQFEIAGKQNVCSKDISTHFNKLIYIMPCALHLNLFGFEAHMMLNDSDKD